MAGSLAFSLWAVHISDGVLSARWLAGGFVLAGLLALLGAWRIRDEEIPRVALLTAAFFVASLIHVRVGPTSVHLLLNGLVGVVLGRRAGLAIFLGLGLQAALLQHGGYLTLGVNTCVMALPALVSWQLFAGLQRLQSLHRPSFRAALVAGSAWLWLLSLVYGVTLLATNRSGQISDLNPGWANRITFHPATLAGVLALAAVATWAERRLENAPEFPLGLLVGETAVLLTVLLNGVVLVGGGQEEWPSLVLVTVVPHLVIAVFEGIILGFTVGFLARVKPEMLNGFTPEKTACLADPVP
jgi:cobalt/nickel transport system permease protein